MWVSVSQFKGVVECGLNPPDRAELRREEKTYKTARSLKKQWAGASCETLSDYTNIIPSLTSVTQLCHGISSRDHDGH